MDYIKFLRSKVGHAPVIITGSSVVVINEKKEILLQKRSDNKMWGLPGGAMEPGESYEEVAIRETKEETGLKIENLKFIHLFSGENIHYIYPNGDEVYNTIARYESRTFSGNIKTSDESIELRWFHLNNLPNSIAPPKAIHEFLLNYYRDELI